MRNVSLVIFTDLDGSLLDHATYSFEQADEGLSAACRANVPVILCSSKTRAEIETLQCNLMVRYPYFDENNDLLFQPFISENGGALFVPQRYFAYSARPTRRTGPYDVFEFGRPYSEVIDVLHQAAESVGVGVTGFSDMSEDEIASQCACSVHQARLAKQREYDEPFKFCGGSVSARRKLLQALRLAGLQLTRGGRFEHVMGMTDKGKAARCLKAMYEKEPGRRVVSVGLGDSTNDAELLAAVDIPVIVRNNPADVARLQKVVPSAYVTESPGPAGWAQAVAHLVGAFAGRTSEVAQ